MLHLWYQNLIFENLLRFWRVRSSSFSYVSLKVWIEWSSVVCVTSFFFWNCDVMEFGIHCIIISHFSFKYFSMRCSGMLTLVLLLFVVIILWWSYVVVCLNNVFLNASYWCFRWYPVGNFYFWLNVNFNYC